MSKVSNSPPSVSVVLSVYNEEEHIGRSIESILNQTLTNFEFIIIDDGSTDDTLRIIKSYKDSRIVLISRENKGLVASLNEGIEKSQGRYVARQDADDLSLPNRLEKEVDFLDDNTAYAVVCTNVLEINSEDKIANTNTIYHSIPNGALELAMMWVDPVAHGTVMARREVIASLGGYMQAAWPSEDYDLWARVVKANWRIGKIDEDLYLYRVNEQGISLSNIDRQRIAAQRVQDDIRERPIPILRGNYYFRTHIEKLRYIGTLARNFRLINMLKAALRTSRAPAQINARASQPNILHISLAKTLGGGEVVMDSIISSLADDYRFSLLAPQALFATISSRTPAYPLITRLRLDSRIMQKLPFLRVYLYNLLLWLCLPTIRFDLIHLHQFDGELITALPSSSRRLLTAHTRYLFSDSFAPRALVMLKKLDGVIAVSDATKSDLIRLGLDKSVVSMVTNGVDGAALLGLSINRPRESIIWAGRLEKEDKNPDLLLDIAKVASHEFSFVMYGEGSYKRALEGRIKRESITNISFGGFVRDKEKMFDDALLCCITSDREAMPLIALESMAAAIPVVSTDVGDMKKLIVGSGAGVVVSEPSPQAFLEAFRRILKPEVYTKYARDARGAYEGGYSLEKMTKKTEGVYRGLLK